MTNVIEIIRSGHYKTLTLGVPGSALQSSRIYRWMAFEKGMYMVGSFGDGRYENLWVDESYCVITKKTEN